MNQKARVFDILFVVFFYERVENGLFSFVEEFSCYHVLF